MIRSLGALAVPLALAAWFAGGSAGATSPSPLEVETPAWAGRAHHVDSGGFRNPWVEDSHRPLGRTLWWLLRHGLASRPGELPEVLRLDPAEVAADDGYSVRWLGHSTAIVTIGGRRVLTDPIFDDNASPFPFGKPKRLVGFPLELEELPKIDAVVISHNHYDHLSRATLEAIVERDDPLIAVPLGVDRRLRRWGLERVQALDWWQSIEWRGLRLRAVPARHTSQRSVADRAETLWAGWWIEGAGGEHPTYFAGCTAYAPHFREIGERLGPAEVAMIPIGAYLPRWLMEPVHMVPEDSVRGFVDLRAKRMLGIHWGTFDLADEDLDEPPRRVRAAALEFGVSGRVHLPPIGGVVP